MSYHLSEHEESDLEINQETLAKIADSVLALGSELGFFDEEFVPILVLVTRKLCDEFNVADVRSLETELN